MTGATMEYMSRKKDQNGISHPRMTLIGILKFDGGTKSEYGVPTWNIWGSKDQNGISPNIFLYVHDSACDTIVHQWHEPDMLN